MIACDSARYTSMRGRTNTPAGHSRPAVTLGIAERTVRAHLTELFQLLGVHGRMPAVIRARELGMIE